MKLAYITNVPLSATDAQSIQVRAMAHTFGTLLGDEFVLYSPGEEDGADRTYRWVPIRVVGHFPRALRYGLFILTTLTYTYRSKPEHIYSRDIGVIAVYRLLGYKTTYEIHKPFQTRVGHVLFRLLSRYITVVSISHALKAYVLATYPISEKRVCVAHDGVFLEDYNMLEKKSCQKKLRHACHATADQKVVLYSSNLYPGKGLELIEAAASKLPHMIFVIMGKQRDGGDAPNALSPNVVYLGRKKIEEVPLYISGADLLVIPFTKQLLTWQYHSALKSFEYMASRVPIVTSDIGSLREIFSESNAWLFSPENTESFIHALEAASSDLDLSYKKSAQAYTDVQAYTWHKRALNILSFLNI